jgi:hypothetical protein
MDFNKGDLVKIVSDRLRIQIEDEDDINIWFGHYGVVVEFFEVADCNNAAIADVMLSNGIQTLFFATELEKQND